MRWLLVASALVACGHDSQPTSAPPAPVAKVPAPTPPAPAPAIDAGTALVAMIDAGVAPTVAGFDFIADAKRLYRVVGCGGGGPLPRRPAEYPKGGGKH